MLNLHPDAEYFIIKITWGRGGAEKLRSRPWEELCHGHPFPMPLFLQTRMMLRLPSLLMELVFIEQSEQRGIQRNQHDLPPMPCLKLRQSPDFLAP